MMNLGIVPLPLNADLTGYWTMWATVATAAATVGLIVVAVFAWRAALRTLQGQQTHAEIMALKDYMKALHTLAGISETTPAAYMPAEFMDNVGLRIAQMNAAYPVYVDAVSKEVRVAGSIWRAYHANEAAKGFRMAEGLLVQAQGWRIEPSAGSEAHTHEQYELNRTFAVRIADHALHWQSNPASRVFEDGRLEKTMHDFRTSSPCRRGRKRLMANSKDEK